MRIVNFATEPICVHTVGPIEQSKFGTETQEGGACFQGQPRPMPRGGASESTKFWGTPTYSHVCCCCYLLTYLFNSTSTAVSSWLWKSRSSWSTSESSRAAQVLSTDFGGDSEGWKSGAQTARKEEWRRHSGLPTDSSDRKWVTMTLWNFRRYVVNWPAAVALALAADDWIDSTTIRPT